MDRKQVAQERVIQYCKKIGFDITHTSAIDAVAIGRSRGDGMTVCKSVCELLGNSRIAQMIVGVRLPTRPILRLTMGAMAACAASLVHSAAKAQTPSPLAEWQYSAGIPLQKTFQQDLPRWQAELGVGAQYAPLYDGAQRYRVEPGPTVNLRYRDLFFASTGEGVGFNLASAENYRIGAAVTYDLGRRAADYNSRLHGLGNINPAAEVKLFADYVVSKTLPLVVRVDIRRALGGSDGLIGDVGAYLPLPGSSKRFIWFAGPTMTVADETYMNSYFGVGRAQSERSQYAPYKPSAGIKSAGFGVSATWFVTEQWILNATTGFSELVGSASRGPITESSSEGVFSLSAAYKF